MIALILPMMPITQLQIKPSPPIILSLLMAVIAVAVFQDFMHAVRNGYSFYWYESLLFKSFWLCFAPLLLLFKYHIKNTPLKSTLHSLLAVITLTLTHILLTAFIIGGLSSVFLDHTYGLIKVITYTFSNDLIKLLLVYGLLVLIHKPTKPKARTTKPMPPFMIVSTGNSQVRINHKDIVFIQAATPYIAIHLSNKQYLHNTTLTAIQHKLDYRFIRVHKSSIVNIDQVVSCQSRLNGDYDLLLANNMMIRLSRNYAAAFKHSFTVTPQLKA